MVHERKLFISKEDTYLVNDAVIAISQSRSDSQSLVRREGARVFSRDDDLLSVLVPQPVVHDLSPDFGASKLIFRLLFS